MGEFANPDGVRACNGAEKSWLSMPLFDGVRYRIRTSVAAVRGRTGGNVAVHRRPGTPITD